MIRYETEEERREARLASKRKYYLNHKEKCLAKSKIYSQTNKERTKQRSIERKEELKIYRRSYFLKNKEKLYMKRNAYRNRTRLEDKTSEMLSVAKYRAKKRNLEFNITKDDIKIPEYCPLLNIKLDLEINDKDYRPSIDRIDSSKGYTKDNIWVISFKANRFKSDATIEEILLMAKNINKIKGVSC